MTVFHPDQVPNEGRIHVAHDFSYADSTEREAATGFVAGDLHKLALQLDDFSLWILTAITPTWISVGGSVVANFTDLADVPASYVGAGLQAVRVNATEDGLEFVSFPTGNLHEVEDAITAAVTNVVTLSHNSTGTPAVGFGTGIEVLAETNTTSDTPIGNMNWFWRDSTHASRISEFEVIGYDAANLVYLIRVSAAGIGAVTPNPIGLGAVDLMPSKSVATDVPAAAFSFLGAGSDNAIGSGSGGSAIIGGFANVITGTLVTSGILSGSGNSISASLSSIVGGGDNSITSDSSGIVAGEDNTINEDHSFIGGGYTGIIGAGAGNSGIVGGYSNQILTHPYSFIGGGTNNFVVASRSAAVGGGDNLIYGAYSFAGGGKTNRINSAFSAAFGTDALVENSRTLALGGASLFAVGDAQFLVTPISRQVTHSSSAWFPLFIDAASERLVIPSDTIWTFSILLSGITSGAAKTFAFKIEGAIENDGGTTAILGTPTVTTLYDTDDVSFDVRVTADDTNDALLVEVSDSDGGGDLVRWFGTVMRSSVTF